MIAEIHHAGRHCHLSILNFLLNEAHSCRI
jgi:hypothetical protein